MKNQRDIYYQTLTIFLPLRLNSQKKKTKAMTTIIPIDSNSIPKTVPNSHTWEIPTIPNKPISGSGSNIPVIDLAGPEAVSEIRRACETWGVFHATNHGMSGELFKEMEDQLQRLFSLPAERKLAAVRPPEGGAGYGVPPIAGFFSKLMWSEGYSVFGSPVENARKLWPDHEERGRFCDVMSTYQKEIKQLSGKMMGLMIESLGLSKEDTKWAEPNKNGLSHPDCFLQMNFYPTCPDPTKAMGLVPHSDSSLITLLYQSNGVVGLQVIGEEGSVGWVKVHPVEGALVIIVGDLMHILSNGRFKNVFHRAVPSATSSRLSVVHLYGPPGDVEVAPLTQLTDIDNPPIYNTVTWNQLRKDKITRRFDVLDSIKIKY